MGYYGSSQRSSCSQSCPLLQNSLARFPTMSDFTCAPACSCPLPPLPPSLSSAAGPFLPVLPLGGEHGISRPAAEPAHSLIHCRTMDQTSALLQFQLFPTSFPSLSCRRTPLALNHWTSSPLACGWQSPLDGLMDEWKCERRPTQSCHVLEKL